MKREIKFEYGFESVKGIVKKVYYLAEIPNIKEKCDVWDVLPIVYVRQFTGLTDKNGNDIYEGDILDLGYNYKVIIYFEEGTFGYIGNYGLFVPLRGTDMDYVSYIGNIFENPEFKK